MKNFLGFSQQATCKAVLLCVLIALAACMDKSERAYSDALAAYSEKRYARAVSLLQEPVNARYPPAMTLLGMLYLYGYGVPQNAQQATYWLKEAELLDDVNARSTLGVLYVSGIGVTRDVALGESLLEQAASHGDQIAIKALGYMRNHSPHALSR